MHNCIPESVAYFSEQENSMNLLDRIRSHDDCFYYPKLKGKNATLDFNDDIQCMNLIETYYKSGGKESVFNFDFLHLFSAHGKHIHTASLYFIGCLLQRLVEDNLRKFIEANVQGLNYNFKYSWFLSCLYHDTASAIENQPFHIKPLSYYLGINNISHIVYDHKAIVPYAELFTYPISLVKNYFQFRLEYCSCVDHGILGGFLLFDRLRKNYDATWKKHSNEVISFQNGVFFDSYDHFKYSGLDWRIAQLDHFAIIADSIIGHNMWVSDDTNLYNNFGLTPLIKSADNRVKITDRPLLFFLSLIDSIDPVKLLGRKPIEVKPMDALKSIDFDLVSNHEIKVTALSATHFLYYHTEVKKVEDWLDVTVEDISNNTFTITVM